MILDNANTGQEFYQPSGQINAARTALSLAMAFILSVSIGAIYSILTFYMVVVYFNFVILYFTLFLLTFIPPLTIWVGHIRNEKWLLGVTFFCSFSALYGAWVAYTYLWLAPYMGEYITLFDLVNPISFFSIWVNLFPYVSYSIFGLNMQGSALFGPWIIEALLFVIYPLLQMRKYNIPPYSELLQKWYPKLKFGHRYPTVYNVESLRETISEFIKLEKGALKPEGSYAVYSVFYMYYLEGMHNQYMDVKVVTASSKGERGEYSLINVAIPGVEAERFKQADTTLVVFYDQIYH